MTQPRTIFQVSVDCECSECGYGRVGQELVEALGELADTVADGSEIKRLTRAMAKAGAALAKATK